MVIFELNGIGTVEIAPIQGRYTDLIPCTLLSVHATFDDFYSSAIVTWILSYMDTDGMAKTSLTGSLTISGENYTSWSGDNSSPFMLVADAFPGGSLSITTRVMPTM